MLMPVALLIGAVLMPYAIDQLRLQNAATTGYHCQNPHLFDMAWLVGVVTVLALVGAVVREARGLFAWVGGASPLPAPQAGLRRVCGLVRCRPGPRDGGRSRPRRAPPKTRPDRLPDAYTAAHACARRRPAAAPSTRWVGGVHSPRPRRDRAISTLVPAVLAVVASVVAAFGC